MARQTDAMDEELPEVEYRDSDESGHWAVFTNGGALKYTRDNGTVFEEIFAPSDPRSVMERSKVGEDDGDLAEFLDVALEMYDEYETVGDLMQDWTTLAEWITHD